MLTTGVTPKIKLPYPHPGQQHVRTYARRFNWLAAGRRWRKTTLAMPISVEAATKGQTIIWGAPTFDQVRIGFAETKRAMGGYADFNYSRMTAELPTGGKIIYRSLDDPDNARGHSADGVVLDEVGFIKAAAWYEVLRPMLIDSGGWLWGIGTPNGRNFFYQEWMKAKDHDDVMAWQIPTLGVKITDRGLEREPHPLENPHIQFEEIENIYRTMPFYVFQQEILAEFIESGGGIFRRVMECATATAIEEPIEGRQYVAGVDIGLKVDFTVVSVFDVESREQVYMDRFNQVPYSVLYDRLEAVHRRFNLQAMTIEDNSIGTPPFEEMQERGLPVIPFHTTNTTKQAIIQSLAAAFEHGEIKILNDPVQVGELQAFEGKRLPGGGFTYGAPAGLHDDTVMAMAICWQGISKPAPFSVLIDDIDLSIYKSKRTSIWDSKNGY